jgi:hypothetical protein
METILRVLFVNYLEPIAYLVYLLAVWLYESRKGDTRMKPLRLYYFLAFALMMTASLLVEFDIESTLYYHIHAVFTIWFLGLYFRSLLQNRYKKNTVLFLIVATTVYLIVKNLILREVRLFDSIGYSLVSASVVLFVFLYFHQELSNVKDQNILDDINFWLSSGFLIYFLGSFIIFLTYHYFTLKILATYTLEDRAILTNLWGLHNCLLFVGALSLLGGSLWIIYRKKSALS